jgi:hypothetical protein
MSEQRVSLFANGSEYMMWMELNCYRCKKYDENNADVEVCAIDYHVGYASITDGTIPHEIAKRMGRLDHPVNEIFQCHEYEAKERE